MEVESLRVGEIGWEKRVARLFGVHFTVVQSALIFNDAYQ